MRYEMKRKEDARVVRTRQKLFTSFKELLGEKTFEEITINEICIRADIRRATFYKHFTDKYDFLAGLTRHLRYSFEEKFDTIHAIGERDLSVYYLEYLRAIIDFLDSNEDIVNLIFDSNMTSSLVSVIIDENYERTKEKLECDVKQGLKIIASPDTVAIYLAGGISHTLIKWLKSGKKTSRTELTNEIISIISAVFVK
jgi:AcrR family transcriptional regulator